MSPRLPLVSLAALLLLTGVGCATGSTVTEKQLASVQRLLSEQREATARLEDAVGELVDQNTELLEGVAALLDEDDDEDGDGTEAHSAAPVFSTQVRAAQWCVQKSWQARGDSSRVLGVAVTVKNQSSAPERLLLVGYQLVDGKGRKYPLSLLGCEHPLKTDEVAAGAESELELPFRVPADAVAPFTLLVVPGDPSQAAVSLPVPAVK